MTGNQRKRRSDTGPRLTQRDLYTLWWIGQQYAARFDQLQKILGEQAQATTKEKDVLSSEATRHAVTRWNKAGLAEYRKILVDSPGWVWLTTKGLEAAGLSEFKKYEPSPSTLNHMYWTNQARMFLTTRYPDGLWTPERYIRARKNDTDSHIPDAEFTLEGKVIPVEIEITQKSARRISAILDDLLTTYRGPVWYFVHKDSYQAISAAWKQLNEAQRGRVSVSKLADLE